MQNFNDPPMRRSSRSTRTKSPSILSSLNKDASSSFSTACLTLSRSLKAQQGWRDGVGLSGAVCSVSFTCSSPGSCLTDWLDSIIFRLQVNSLLGHLFDLIRRLSNGPTAGKKRHEKGIVKWWSRPCHPLLWRKKKLEDGQLKSWDRGREEKTMFSLPHLIFYRIKSSSLSLCPWCHWWGMRYRFILHTDSQLLLIALWMVLYVSITKVSFTLSSIFSRWE